MKNIVYKASLIIVPLLYSVLSKILFSTCRIKVIGEEHYNCRMNSEQPFIAAFWHYSVFFIINSIKGKDWVAMVSGSKDAEYVSQLLESWGLQTVRGSRGKGGLVALREMRRIIIDKGKKAAIVADGSQGPPRQVQVGAILLASKTGIPILPIAWSAERYWVFKSWDRTILPKPGSRLAVIYGPPLQVPASIRSVELEEFRVALEKRLNTLYDQSWEYFGAVGHY